MMKHSRSIYDVLPEPITSKKSRRIGPNALTDWNVIHHIRLRLMRLEADLEDAPPALPNDSLVKALHG